MVKTNKIVIYGTGGLGRGLIELINVINNCKKQKWEFLGFIDDNVTGNVNGFSILGNFKYLLNYKDDLNVVLAFGNPNVKKQIFEDLKYKQNIKFPNLIHPSVELSPFNVLGKGNIISKGVSLSTNININNFNLIHYNCSVGHDVRMGNFNSIFPLTALSGYVSLDNCVEIGTNAAIIPEKHINSHARIGAGSVVVHHVKEGATIVGVPGRENNKTNR